MSRARWIAAIGLAAALAPASAMAAPGVMSKDMGGADAAREFWTPKRMAKAQPMDAFARPTPSVLPDYYLAEPASPQAPPERIHSTDGSGPSTYADAVTIEDTTAVGIRTHGKIFFQEGQSLFVCSGTVITSGNESTVWTAGHCVFDQQSGQFAKNFVFVPGYDHGNVRPFGTWPAQEIYTTTSYTGGGNERSDMGTALLKTSPPQKSCRGLNKNKKKKCRAANKAAVTIQDTVGSRGIAFNLPTTQTWTAYGYPASPAPRFDGDDLEACTGTLKADDQANMGAPAPFGIDCDMQGGASGGGYVINNDMVNGNIAYGYPNLDAHTVYSPYFGTFAQGFYNTVESCPKTGCNF